MKFALDDAEMDAQLQRTATAAHSASADLGEALTTARRVSPGDYDAWFAEWASLAERADSQARVSAGVKKRFHRFTETEGAGGHCCGLGATLWEQVTFDWLDEVLVRGNTSA